MLTRFKIVIALVVALCALPFMASAQTSSVNAYSPYSMYGPGELLTPGSVQMRSMGGVGIGQRSVTMINTLNPAAASVAPQKSMLFEASFDATHYRNNQPKYGADGALMSTAKTAYNTVNIHHLSLLFPLAKSLGVNFSLAPYSSVGYKMKVGDETQDNWADIGRVMYGYSGEGDISEVKLSLGWAPWRNFSIGVAAKYYWGSIERVYIAEVTHNITGGGNINATRGVDYYVVNNFKMQVGMQWNIISNESRLFTLGATYDLGGRLNPKRTSYVYTDNPINSINPVYVRNNLQTLDLVVPHQVGVGVYYQDRMIGWGLDYSFAAWGANNGGYNENDSYDVPVMYCDTHTIKAGFEITPRRNDVRNYFNRVSYRAGVRLGNYYQTFAGERVNQLAVTAGIGFPVKVWGSSSINVGFEYGRMSAPQAVNIDAGKIGLVTQTYYKISLGFDLFSADTTDYWFVRQKFD